MPAAKQQRTVLIHFYIQQLQGRRHVLQLLHQLRQMAPHIIPADLLDSQFPRLIRSRAPTNALVEVLSGSEAGLLDAGRTRLADILVQTESVHNRILGLEIAVENKP